MTPSGEATSAAFKIPMDTYDVGKTNLLVARPASPS